MTRRGSFPLKLCGVGRCRKKTTGRKYRLQHHFQWVRGVRSLTTRSFFKGFLFLRNIKEIKATYRKLKLELEEKKSPRIWTPQGQPPSTDSINQDRFQQFLANYSNLIQGQPQIVESGNTPGVSPCFRFGKCLPRAYCGWCFCWADYWLFVIPIACDFHDAVFLENICQTGGTTTHTRHSNPEFPAVFQTGSKYL